MKKVYAPPQMSVFVVQFQSGMLQGSLGDNNEGGKGQGNIPTTQNDNDDYDW